jgi:DNA-binding MarR family transcriptional regulator
MLNIISMNGYNDCILFLLAKAYQKASATFKKELQEYGLTPVQNLVIQALQGEEGLSAGELGKRLLLDNATLSGILDRLADNGWILKELDDADKRFLKIKLTQQTIELLETLIQATEKANEEVIKSLRVEERLLLKRILIDLQK